jgi:mannose-6-phosphate isomerase-like protein (cupin superfamily)
MQLLKQDKLPLSRIARELVGAEHALGISLLFVEAEPGRGPSLHTHPYAEVFIVQEGQGTYTVGDKEVEARAGDILLVDAGEPHSFVSSGTEPLRQIDIHLSPSFSTEWLEDCGEG